jgi:hypothetical protein
MKLSLPRETEQIDAFEREKLTEIEQRWTDMHAPVRNLAAEKQQQLLTEPLYSSWLCYTKQRSFLAAANVSVYTDEHQTPLDADVLLSLDVQVATEWWHSTRRSYTAAQFGKSPEVIIEIVSNNKGNEESVKLRDYAHMGVKYYCIYDPAELLGSGILRMYMLRGTAYVGMIDEYWLPGVDLGLRLWHGPYEGMNNVWLRWCDREGTLILTGAERAEQERQLAEQERLRAERLSAQLRALGIEPEA